MNRLKLLPSLALAALVGSAPGAFGQVVNAELINLQGTLNVAPIANVGFIGAGNLAGDASAAVIQASGAQGSVAFTTANQNGPVLNIVGVSVQGTVNTGFGIIANAGIIAATGPIAGDAATASVSASGATSSIGITTVNTNDPFFGGEGDVTTVIGAAAQLTINAPLIGGVFNIGAIGAGSITGNGAAAAVAASGATSSVSVTTVDTAQGGLFASGDSNAAILAVVQGTANFAPIVNIGLIALGSNGAISGDGASAVIAASGATSSVSVTNINSVDGSDTLIGAVGQGTFNGGVAVILPGAGVVFLADSSPIFNTGLIVAGGGVTGAGATAAVQASGATSSVSVANVAGDFQNPFAVSTTLIGVVGQVTQNFGSVTNFGVILLGNGDISGNGATAAVSASGAVSSVSVSNVSTDPSVPFFGSIPSGANSVTAIGVVGQVTLNIAPVLNVGLITSGDLSGVGSSAVISASGATSSVAVTNLSDSPAGNVTTVGLVGQATVNLAPVTNAGVISAGNLSGAGATAAVTAAGATSVVSISNIAGR